MRLLATLLLFIATAAFACDPSFPTGVHPKNHKLIVTYSSTFHYVVKDPASDDYAKFMDLALNTLAKKTSDVAFERVKKDVDANLVFRVDFYFDETTQTSRTVIAAYGLGKTDQLFVVIGTRSLAPGATVGEVEAHTFLDTIVLAFYNITHGWTCVHDPSVPHPRWPQD